MKKAILLIFSSIVLLACGGVKKTQQALNTGNYLTAMNRSINQLADNKTKRGHQEFVILLEDAFAKNVKRELQQINFLKNTGNPARLSEIYEAYVGLKNIQQRIQPLLPLPVYAENRNANFDFQKIIL